MADTSKWISPASPRATNEIVFFPTFFSLVSQIFSPSEHPQHRGLLIKALFNWFQYMDAHVL